MIGPIYIPKFGSYKVRTLLNWVPGAIHAVSVDRLLKSDYGGPVAQIRNTANNAEARFTWSDWIGGSAEGFASDSNLVTAFDQTGNRRHWNQSTTSAQPVIVSSGSFPRYMGGNAIGADFLNTATHYMDAISTQGLLPTLTNGFTMIVKVSDTTASTSIPTIFGNSRGIQSYNPGSFSINNRGRIINEKTNTTSDGVTSNVDGERIIIAVFTNGTFTRYSSTYGGAMVTQSVSTTWVNTANNSNLRVMISTSGNGAIDADRRVFGRLSTTVLYPKALTSSEAQTAIGLLW